MLNGSEPVPETRRVTSYLSHWLLTTLWTKCSHFTDEEAEVQAYKTFSYRVCKSGRNPGSLMRTQLCPQTHKQASPPLAHLLSHTADPLPKEALEQDAPATMGLLSKQEKKDPNKIMRAQEDRGAGRKMGLNHPQKITLRRGGERSQIDFKVNRKLLGVLKGY